MLFTENRFGWLQTASWLSAIGCGLYAFWHAKSPEDGKPGLNWKFWENWRTDRLFLVLALFVAVLGLTFRMKDLAGTPPEVVSAQVETYYSVSEIRQGGNYVLFSRNTVPEPLNYYWANLVSFFPAELSKCKPSAYRIRWLGLLGSFLCMDLAGKSQTGGLGWLLPDFRARVFG